MPRKVLSPKTNAKRKTWDKKAMTEAIKLVRSETIGLKKAVKMFKVPKTTLQRLVHDKTYTPEEVVEKKLGRKPVLPINIENDLVKYLLLMESKYYGLTRRDVKRMAYELAVRNGISHPFGEKSEAGRAWLDHFLHRHKDKLSIRKPTGTSYARARGFNVESVNNFFDMLEMEYDRKKFDPDRIYNVDETGLSIVQSKIPQIVGLKGKRQIGALTAAERGSLVTVICCMSAGGTFVPPMMIFPRKNMTETLMRGAPLGTLGRCHPSGWVQTNLFSDWFKHFIKYTKPSEESPVLLLLDGHYSHTRNIEIIDLARENHITIVCLPPHATHKLQPLDKTFMGSLKSHYSEAIRIWLRHSERPVGPYDIAELFGKAYVNCQTASIAINGFSRTGIYPCDRGVFTEVDFIAAEHEVLGETSSEQALNNVAAEARCSSTADVRPSTPHTLVSPAEILPVPQPKKKMSNRGRKASSAAVITSSPYKTELENSISKSDGKKKIPSLRLGSGTVARRGRGSHQNSNRGLKRSELCTDTVRHKKLKKKTVESSDSDQNDLSSVSSASSEDMDIQPGKIPTVDDDAECMFCDQKFSKDTRGELWIQCVMCNLWAHSDCSDWCDKDAYTCDFCRS